MIKKIRTCVINLSNNKLLNNTISYLCYLLLVLVCYAESYDILEPHMYPQAKENEIDGGHCDYNWCGV